MSRNENAKKMRDQLQQDFNDWSSLLTDHSLHACYAIIAAIWAVHSDVNAILNNPWAKWSLVMVLSFLGLNIIIEFVQSRLHFNRYYYAEENQERWEQEYKRYNTNQGGRSPWPYTKAIENVGIISRCLKVIVPVIAASLLIISIFQ